MKKLIVICLMCSSCAYIKPLIRGAEDILIEEIREEELETVKDIAVGTGQLWAVGILTAVLALQAYLKKRRENANRP